MPQYVRWILMQIKFRKNVRFDHTVMISSNSSFEGCNSIYSRTMFSGSLGYGSYIGSDSSLIAKVGRFTSIAPFVRSNNGIHPNREPYVTTSPMFFSTSKQAGKTFATYRTFQETKPIPEIGNDCWIGESVFICPNVKIGDGAIIYAGAVVTKDVPPYAVVAGVPAKIIRYRYDDETIEYLLKIKWWDFPVQWLKGHWELFNDIEELKKEILKHGIPQQTLDMG